MSYSRKGKSMSADELSRISSSGSDSSPSANEVRIVLMIHLPKYTTFMSIFYSAPDYSV